MFLIRLRQSLQIWNRFIEVISDDVKTEWFQEGK